MNICMVTSVPMAQPWDQADKNLAYMLACALPQRTFQALTIAGEDGPPGPNIRPLPLFRSRRPTMGEKLALFGQLLARPLVDRSWQRPDLYHFVYRPYQLSSLLCRGLPEFRSKPTIHTLPASSGGIPLTGELFFADCTVALSNYGRALLERLGVPNVRVIPPGIVIGAWEALQGQTERLKAQLGLRPDPVVLFPSHYDPDYGADVVLNALPAIAAAHPNVQIVFACRPRSPYAKRREQAVKQIIEQLRLTHAARFFEIVPDMQTLIGASDIIMLPIETMRDKMDLPTTLLEAMAAGKPIIISDIPPMNELLDDEQAGLTVPPGDAAALAQAVIGLLSDRDLRERMGRQGAALVRERYDIRHVAQQYDRLYQELRA